MKRKRFFIMLAGLFTATLLYSQVVGVKTNLLMDATRTINLGAEIALGKKTTLDLYANYNPWTYGDNKMMKMLMVQPEYRHWFCDRFNGHFVGVHAIAGIYQMAGMKLPFGIWPQLEDHRFKGHFFGAGVSYGYQWILSKSWNVEANIGVGYINAQFEQFECKTCGKKVDEGNKNYVGPTKAAVSLIYLF